MGTQGMLMQAQAAQSLLVYYVHPPVVQALPPQEKAAVIPVLACTTADELRAAGLQGLPYDAPADLVAVLVDGYRKQVTRSPLRLSSDVKSLTPGGRCRRTSSGHGSQ